ncbi:hypothetical protein B7463_g4607, partial [Scytalidium lignicola]
MSGQSPAPPFSDLRLASLSNLPRIGVVAAAGFKYSQVFEFTRPYHNQYPEDTVKDYQRIFREQILDPEWIVLVKEDLFDPNEGEEGILGLGPKNRFPDPAVSSNDLMERVIVGVCSWKLEEGSHRKGDFQPPSLDLASCEEIGYSEEISGFPSRDIDPERLRRVNRAIDEIEKEYFRHACLLEMIVVHPTYWRRGHGSALASWGISLTKLDNVNHGVIASKMGEVLFSSLGFEYIKHFHVEGDEDAPKGIDLAVFAIWRRKE